MKKRGFTLIELLAVIVILAIIALIATPIVMNVIENSRKGAAERSAENYVDAVELAIASERINGPVTDGEYKIQEDGSLCIVENGTVDCDKSQLEVEVNGEKPSAGGTILIENGQVVDKLTGDTTKKSTMTVGDYTVSYNAGKIKATKITKLEMVCNPATQKAKAIIEVWSDEAEDLILSEREVGLLASEEENKYAKGVTYICDPGDGVKRHFLVIEDGDDTELTKGDFTTVHYTNDKIGTTSPGEVSLIMLENIDNSTIQWAESGNTSEGPVTALSHLQNLTSEWSVEVSLPTYAQLNGFKYNRINLSVNEGLPFGYWLSTAADSEYSYVVHFNLSVIDSGPANDKDYMGVRPVITVPKDHIG